MHSDTFKFLIDRTKKAHDFHIRLLAQNMQRPGTILAAAP